MASSGDRKLEGGRLAAGWILLAAAAAAAAAANCLLGFRVCATNSSRVSFGAVRLWWARRPLAGSDFSWSSRRRLSDQLGLVIFVAKLSARECDTECFGWRRQVKWEPIGRLVRCLVRPAAAAVELGLVDRLARAEPLGSSSAGETTRKTIKCKFKSFRYLL